MVEVKKNKPSKKIEETVMSETKAAEIKALKEDEMEMVRTMKDPLGVWIWELRPKK